MAQRPSPGRTAEQQCFVVKKYKLGRWLPRPNFDPLARVIKPGAVINDVAAHEDMMTTLLAAAGAPDIKPN